MATNHSKIRFAKVHSAQADLAATRQVDIEVDISIGLHSFNIVGLPDKAIEEARDRISSAIKHAGFVSPKQKNQKVVISLAPADLRKNGTKFDLPMAVAYLSATSEIEFNSSNKIFVGELSLDGRIRAICGVLPIVAFAKNNRFKEVFIPAANAEEASLISGIKIFAVENLGQIISHLLDREKIAALKCNSRISVNHNRALPNHNGASPNSSKASPMIDLSEIKGNDVAKRGLLIAASGGHNIAFWGPPGTGKTMLARAFSGLLPPLTPDKMIESTSIYSITGNNTIISNPPLRSPHHTSSYAAIIGGKTCGEITLAHNGVLFLDEFPEFDRRVVDSLRQPIEDGFIKIARSEQTSTFPAKFLLIATMNPCPCGFFKTNIKKCLCTHGAIEKYRRKISGPILDRIDMWIEVSKVDHSKLVSEEEKVGAHYRDVVRAARRIQQNRSRQVKKLNGELSGQEIMRVCAVDLKSDSKMKEVLDAAAEKLGLSARGYHKILKLARTIADIELSRKIKTPHILEALQYRSRQIYD